MRYIHIIAYWWIAIMKASSMKPYWKISQNVRNLYEKSTESTASVRAPSSTSKRTQSVRPLSAARMSAVFPPGTGHVLYLSRAFYAQVESERHDTTKYKKCWIWTRQSTLCNQTKNKFSFSVRLKKFTGARMMKQRSKEQTKNRESNWAVSIYKYHILPWTENNVNGKTLYSKSKHKCPVQCSST